MSFETLGLLPELLKAVADQGYTEATPIQTQAIPVVLQGRDVMGGAQTGTGKTAGFTLPLLQRLSGYANTGTSPARHPIRAVILVPTRELAAQVADSVQTYGKYLPLRSAVVYGGVSIDPQLAELRRGVEILVATPGRLLDHVQQKSVNFSQVEILVLDEADRMLDMGFLPDITRILGMLPAKRQSLLFSATFSEDIKKLADRLLKEPVLIEVARRNTAAESVTQVVYPVDMSRKRELLAHLIKSRDLRQVLVFCRTKQGAGKLATQLERDGISATAIHGDKSQQQRTEALQAFKDGTVRILVGTDVAARGIDIDQLPYVVNFEIPHVPEDYVHRIGRTGRGGSSGTAISLVCEEELKLLDAIEKMLNRKIPTEAIPGFDVASAIVAHPSSEVRTGMRRDREERGERGPRAERGERSDRPERSSRPPRRSHSTVAPDGFDYTKPYEPKPHLPPVLQAAYPPARDDARKPKKPLPALFMPPVPPRPAE
ncbi:MAG: DEAD/DEAH box helicase [Sulfuricella sp.]|nr:DEAD/DEAH box helicase [Sulfuricella sp.]